MKSSHRIASLALASIVTLSVMLGIDRLAIGDTGRAAAIAAAHAPGA